MKYIAWIELIDLWKTVRLKRKSNCKWYCSDELMKQLKDYIETSDNWTIRDQFMSEFKEIKKVLFFFWLKIKKELQYSIEANK